MSGEVEVSIPGSLTRGERVFRGMLGMGSTFAVVAAGFGAVLSFITLFIAGVDWDDLDFMVVAGLGWVAIAFALGMLYGGLLALVARGRSFRQVSILRVFSAGAAIGFIPCLVVLVASLAKGRFVSVDWGVLTIMFPGISAAIASTTLLLARRAKPSLDDGMQNGAPIEDAPSVSSDVGR